MLVEIISLGDVDVDPIQLQSHIIIVKRIRNVPSYQSRYSRYDVMIFRNLSVD